MMPGFAPGPRRVEAPRSTPHRIRTTMSTLSARLLAVALGIAFAASPGLAADKKEKSFGTGKPGSLLLTPAQLKDCLERQDRVQAGTAETTKQQTSLASDRAEIDRRGASLKEQLAKLDHTSADAVAAYNVQAQERDRMIDAYEAAVPAFNAKVEALKADQATFAKSCEGKRYDEADEAALRKGK